MTTIVWKLPPEMGGHVVEMEHRWLTGALQLRCDGQVVHSSPGSLLASARMIIQHPFTLGSHQALLEMTAIGRIQNFRLYVDGQPVQAASESREVRHRVIVMLVGLIIGIILAGLLLDLGLR